MANIESGSDLPTGCNDTPIEMIQNGLAPEAKSQCDAGLACPTDLTTASENSADTETSRDEAKALDSVSTTNEGAIDVAKSLLAQGNRDLLCKEITKAVNHFQEACRLLVNRFGEFADECGEAHLLYGKALVELARMEDEVIGNALQGIPTDDDCEEKLETDDAEKITEEEKEKISLEVYAAMAEREEEMTGDKAEKSADETAVSNDRETTETEVECKDSSAVESNDKTDSTEEQKDPEVKTDGAEKPASTTADDDNKLEGETVEAEDENMETGENEKGDSGEDSSPEQTGEDEKMTTENVANDTADVTNLQLAWEVLEVAKVIFKKHDDQEGKLKLSETFLNLGEVGYESENYEQAINDFQEALKLQRELLEAEDRRIAETLYRLALVYTDHNRYAEALQSYNSAIELIEKRKAILENIIMEHASKTTDESKDLVLKCRTEIVELNGVLPDIMAKIEDLSEDKENVESVKKVVHETMAETTPASAFTSICEISDESVETTDITYLARKKRKPEEDSVDVSKKLCTEETIASSCSSSSDKESNVQDCHNVMKACSDEEAKVDTSVVEVMETATVTTVESVITVQVVGKESTLDIAKISSDHSTFPNDAALDFAANVALPNGRGDCISFVPQESGVATSPLDAAGDYVDQMNNAVVVNGNGIPTMRGDSVDSGMMDDESTSSGTKDCETFVSVSEHKIMKMAENTMCDQAPQEAVDAAQESV